MNNEFDDLFKDFIDDEFSNIKASSEFKKNVIEKSKKSSVTNKLIDLWNYKIEIDLRVCVAAILIVVILPGIYIFTKADEMSKNESKVYEQTIVLDEK